ncbi:MAG: helix-turn-helix domain-containing protein [Acidiferrobacteraceae bacterium]
MNGPDGGTDPGRMLQEARKRLGLSVEEVAERLKLAARQVVAIEQCDFESLPEATYVRGYLRNYAHLAGLPADTVLMAYSRRIREAPEPPPPAPDPVAAPVPGAREPEEPGGPYAIWVGVLFIIVLVAGGWYWHQAGVPGARHAKHGSLAMSQSPMGRIAPVYAPTVTLPPNVPAPRRRVRKPLVPVVPSPSVPPPPLPRAPVQRDQLNGPANTASAPSSAPSRYGRVTLRTGQASDVKIRDATQMVLLDEHLPPGQRVTLNGVPPFTVSLSNAIGAHVRYNGRLLDLGPLRNGNGARVVIGQTAPKQP